MIRLTHPIKAALTLALALMLSAPHPAQAGAGSTLLPATALLIDAPDASPIDNAVFAPSPDALPAPAFNGILDISGAVLQSQPKLKNDIILGRDALRFPALSLEFTTLHDVLVPMQRGAMVGESKRSGLPSYWQVIPQFGKVWREPNDQGWSRAAFPIMLVNDTENHAHQGLATFLYQEGRVSHLRLQFVQQTAPWLLSPHVVLWTKANIQLRQGQPEVQEATRQAATKELAARLEARPIGEFAPGLPAEAFSQLNDPVPPRWQVAHALVHNNILYYDAEKTPFGAYPYPLEMRFGVRSIMKSVATPLSLLRLAQVYGPYVLDLHIGDYVPGADPKWSKVRFIDAANMSSGYGGVGSLVTHPNEEGSGYLDNDYNGWYQAPSIAEKLAHMRTHLKPYPWEPGRVMRYRDHDFFMLGLAVNNFLKSVRGPQADIWTMLQEEVLKPIGIYAAPAVRTREPNHQLGAVWFSAGYYPTLDDLAKLALLYENGGEWMGQQLLHRGLTLDTMMAKGALDKEGDGSADRTIVRDGPQPAQLYRMGFHFIGYTPSDSAVRLYFPTMSGAGHNEVVMYPGHVVGIRIAKVGDLPPGEKEPPYYSDSIPRTLDTLLSYRRTHPQ